MAQHAFVKKTSLCPNHLESLYGHQPLDKHTIYQALQHAQTVITTDSLRQIGEELSPWTYDTG
jgi:hypothetical protein